MEISILMGRSCGNCTFWLKIISIKGACEKYDRGWVNSDHGRDCPGWKRIRDDKPRERINIKQLNY